MREILLVGSGGFIGATLRYLISTTVHRWLEGAGFPYGTLTVNVAGCLLIGFLGGLGETHGLFSSEARLFLFLGLLGGLTTFSSFGHDTFNLARDLDYALALANILLQVGLGMAAVLLGHLAAQMLAPA